MAATTTHDGSTCPTASQNRNHPREQQGLRYRFNFSPASRIHSASGIAYGRKVSR